MNFPWQINIKERVKSQAFNHPCDIYEMIVMHREFPIVHCAVCNCYWELCTDGMKLGVSQTALRPITQEYAVLQVLQKGLVYSRSVTRCSLRDPDWLMIGCMVAQAVSQY